MKRVIITTPPFIENPPPKHSIFELIENPHIMAIRAMSGGKDGYWIMYKGEQCRLTIGEFEIISDEVFSAYIKFTHQAIDDHWEVMLHEFFDLE